MKVTETILPGVLVIEPTIFRDERGLFFEYFQKERYQQHGINVEFVQDNFAYSKKNILRGCHYQLERPQGKLLLVISGQIIDIVIDVRYGSPTFAKTICVELDQYKQVYVPPGFAHGFYVVSAEAVVVYKCTEYYHPASEHGIVWNDDALSLTQYFKDPIVSSKDAAYPRLQDIKAEYLPRYEKT